MAFDFLKIFKVSLARASVSNRTQLILQQARSLHRSGQWESAARAYKSILKVDPACWDAASALASMLLERGDLQGVVEVYSGVIDRCSDHAEAHYKRGNALNLLGHSDKALRDYDRAVFLNPEHANAYCNRGAVLERLGQRKEALDSYDRALGLDPRDALAYYNRASVLRDLGQFDASLASYNQAVALRADFAEAYINRGNLQQQMRQFAAAIDSYDRAIELGPKAPEAFHGRGLAMYQLQKFDAALASYDRAISLKKDYVEAYINRGNVLQDMGRHNEAIVNYDSAISLKSTYAEAHKGRGVSLISLRRFEAAIDSFSKALAIDADSGNILGMRRFVQNADLRMARSPAADVRQLAGVGWPPTGAYLLRSPRFLWWILPSCRSLPPRSGCRASALLMMAVVQFRSGRAAIGFGSGIFPLIFVIIRCHFSLLSSSNFTIDQVSKLPRFPLAQSQTILCAPVWYARSISLWTCETSQTPKWLSSHASFNRDTGGVDLGDFTEHCRTKIFALSCAKQLELSRPFRYHGGELHGLPDRRRHNYSAE